MSTVETDGVRLFHTDKGSGKPILFVHGISEDYRAWGKQIDFFSQHYRQYLTVGASHIQMIIMETFLRKTV